MSARGARPAARASKVRAPSAHPTPLGRRPPQPERLRRVLLAIVLGATVVTWAAAMLQPLQHALARSTLAPAGPFAAGTWLPPSLPPTVFVAVAQAWPLLQSAGRVTLALAHMVSTIGWLAALAELIGVLIWMLRQRRELRRHRGVFLHISAPMPVTARASDAGAELIRNLHMALLPPRGAGAWRWRRHQGVVTLTVSRLPDQVATLGVYIAAPEAQRASLVRTITKVIHGLVPGSLVTEQVDPLRRACEAGRVLVVQELRLAHGPEYPLRHPGDVAVDLLGPLCAALEPRPGTVCTQVHLMLQPARGWALGEGWRSRAMRLLLALQAKEDYALLGDAKAIDAKLSGTAFCATVRLLAVAGGPHERAAAAAEVAEAALICGQYAARTSNCHQFLALAQRRTIFCTGDEPIEFGTLLAMLLRRGQARAAELSAARAWVVRLLWLALAAAGGALVGHACGRWFPLPQLLGPGNTAGSGPVLQTSWLSIRADTAAWSTVWLAAAAALIASRLAPPWRTLQHARAASDMLRRVPRVVLPPRALVPRALWRGPDILTADELSGLWHLPAPALAGLIDVLACRQLPAPPHAFVTAENRHERVIIGHARRVDGSFAPIGPDLHSCREIVHFTAGMGRGKTRLMANLCGQLLPFGFTLLDGKGDDEGNLVTTVRKRIPLADEARLDIIDLLDADWPAGFAALGHVDTSVVGSIDQALGQLLATLSRLDPDTWHKAAGMQQYAQMGALLVLEAEVLPTYAHIKQALLDEAYRNRLLATTHNPEVRTFWTDIYPRTAESQKTSRDALLRRFDKLLVAEVTRYLVTQSVPRLDFLECIEQRRIVLCPMPDKTLGGLSRAIGTLLLQGFVRAVFRRAGSAHDRANYPLLIDEFDTFIEEGDTRDVDDLLTKLRSMGVPGFYTHQVLGQLHELRDKMLINAANRIVFQTNEPDASVYAKLVAEYNLTAADISRQNPLEHQYAMFVAEGMPTGPCSIRPLPWPPELVIELERQRGADWQDALPTGPRGPAAQRIDGVLKTLSWPARHGHAPFDARRFVDHCLELSDGDWSVIRERWRELRLAERDALLDDPGQIADRVERQTWLSRLRICVPRLEATIDYRRVRRAIEGDGSPAVFRAAPARPERPAARASSASMSAAPAPPVRAEPPTVPPPTWRQMMRHQDAPSPAPNDHPDVWEATYGDPTD